MTTVHAKPLLMRVSSSPRGNHSTQGKHCMFVNVPVVLSVLQSQIIFKNFV